jgi:hypothetical protein
MVVMVQSVLDAKNLSLVAVPMAESAVEVAM